MPENPPDAPFDAEHAERYDAKFAKLAPLRDALHQLMAAVLAPLPLNARVLCVGAGTGAEVLALARRFPGWRFTAVDPAGPMLAVCRRRVTEAGFAERCDFHVGYASELPDEERYDAATSILVSQFVVTRAARVEFFRDIRRRLHPGGHLISADLSTGSAANLDEQGLLPVWQRMLQSSNAPAVDIETMLASLRGKVAVVPAADVASLLAEAGFTAPVLFFQTLLIHAWFAVRKA